MSRGRRAAHEEWQLSCYMDGERYVKLGVLVKAVVHIGGWATFLAF